MCMAIVPSGLSDKSISRWQALGSGTCGPHKGAIVHPHAPAQTCSGPSVGRAGPGQHPSPWVRMALRQGAFRALRPGPASEPVTRGRACTPLATS